MTNFTKNMMIAAAALTIAAGVAGAQTIQAEVPFGFRVAGSAMPPGSYRVVADSMSGIHVFTLTSQDTRRSIFTLPYAHDTLKSDGGAPTLTFECSGTDCSLVQVAPGNGEAYQFHKPRLGKDENTRLAVVRAVLVKAR